MSSPSRPVDPSEDISKITSGLQSLSVNNNATTNSDDKKSSDSASNVSAISPSLPTSPSRSYSLDWIASLIRSGSARRIIVMCGAGISVSCGIPDFRSPGTGLYDNLSKYNLPHPTAVFEIDYFRRNPKPFFLLAKELYPSNYSPSPTHHFLKLLHEKGLLLRCFTQNIDGLEALAGIPREAIVQAHGGFSTHDKCIDCGHEVPSEETKEKIFNDAIPHCPHCEGLVKPPIVFFGEALPRRFHQSLTDFADADLLIVMGTSLVVQPFASLINNVKSHCPRILLNNEMAGQSKPLEDDEDYVEMKRQLGVFKSRGDQRMIEAIEKAIGRLKTISSGGFDFSSKDNPNRRDVFHKCLVDDGVRELCKLIGGDWEQQLDALIQKGYRGARNNNAPASPERNNQSSTSPSNDAKTNSLL